MLSAFRAAKNRTRALKKVRASSLSVYPRGL